MINFLNQNLGDLALLAIWGGLWALGGLWITRQSFNLRRNEQVLVGLAVGLIAENWLANILSQFLPLPAAFWAAAGLVFCAGLALGLRDGWHSLFEIPIYPAQWVMLVLLVYIFTGIGRGLAIFDDYAHLPTTSIMAAGDLPPHFSLDPAVPYGYHHFLLLFAAQLMRIGGMYPWNALDVARGLSFGLAILLAGIWVQRLTFSRLAGFLGGVMAAFGMGTRWLLLLLPASVLDKVSQNIQMLGSSAQTAPNLAAALTGTWAIEGAGPIPFPFAFVNGIHSPGVMAHGPNGSIGAAVAFPLLLTFNRWRGWRGAAVSAILWAAITLMTETGIFLSLAGWVVITLGLIIQKRSLKVPRTLWSWWLVMAVGSVIGFLQGGALTEMGRGLVENAVFGTQRLSYQTVGFHLVWPPEIVSSHLGVMSLVNIWQLLAAMAEIGPVILVLPLLLVWGLKAYRSERWYEAAIAASALTGFITMFVEFSGSTGVRNTARLYGFLGPCATFVIPLAWYWVNRRGGLAKSVVAGLGLVTILGGVVLFGIELPAMQSPVYSYFIKDLDVQMERDYWNRLQPGALVFDPIVSRAPTLFGRATNSNITWYKSKPEWDSLNENPDPARLRAYGFQYAYLDRVYWEALTPAQQAALHAPCVQVIKENEDWTHDFRKLLDVSGCR